MTKQKKPVSGKSFFDYPEKEKRRIVQKSIEAANREQQRLVDSVWEKREPIGEYWLEIKSDAPYSIVLHNKNGDTWSDQVRALSHLMTELAKAKQEGRQEALTNAIEDFTKHKNEPMRLGMS